MFKFKKHLLSVLTFGLLSTSVYGAWSSGYANSLASIAIYPSGTQTSVNLSPSYYLFSGALNRFVASEERDTMYAQWSTIPDTSRPASRSKWESDWQTAYDNAMVFPRNQAFSYDAGFATYCGGSGTNKAQKTIHNNEVNYRATAASSATTEANRLNGVLIR